MSEVKCYLGILMVLTLLWTVVANAVMYVDYNVNVENAMIFKWFIILISYSSIIIPNVSKIDSNYINQ